MALTKIVSDIIVPGTISSDKLAAGSGGGGPVVSSVVITDSSYQSNGASTIAASGAGYIKVTGAAFVSGVQVHLDDTAADSITFISSSEVRVQLPSKSAGTYLTFFTNPNGGFSTTLITYA